MNAVPEAPILLIVSGPSGSGKSTLCDRLVREFDRVSYSVSCTTRPRRPGEENGRDYHFLSKEAFLQEREDGAFLEHADVHAHCYGTRRAVVREALADGRDLLMDIDVQGAAQIRTQAAADPLLRDAFVDVFILPPSLDSLERRLVDRGQDAEEVIARRLANAESEIRQRGNYRYELVNDKVDVAYDVLRSIYLAEHHRVRPARGE